jgi:hypothetical protein
MTPGPKATFIATIGAARQTSGTKDEAVNNLARKPGASRESMVETLPERSSPFGIRG